LPAAADEVLARYRARAATYPRTPADLVSSHCDLNPTNTLWDGQRMWLVDWDGSCRNDRFADPAYACNWFVLTPDEEHALLTTVLAAPPTDAQLARLHLMRQACHVFFAMVMLHLAAPALPGRRLPDDALEAEPLAQLRPQMGPLLATPPGQAKLAMASLNEVRGNLAAS
jgi:Ser/Thr protein kinase RdoA (MazF antagonist)